MEHKDEAFPSCDDIASLDKNSEFLPEPLQQFLKTAFCEKKKNWIENSSQRSDYCSKC